MKKIIAVVSMLVLCSCSNIHDVSGKEFEKEYANSRILHTMYGYEYLGEKKGKVYLKKTSVSSSSYGKWQDEIFVADIDDLSPKTRIELKSKNKTYQ